MTKAELIEENTKLRTYLEKIYDAATKEGIEKLMNELHITDWDMGRCAAIGSIGALAMIALERNNGE